MEQSKSETLLCTADESIAATVSAAAAAVERQVARVRDAESLLGRWRDAGVVLVGADLAVAAGRMGLPARVGVYVLGDASAPASALSASVSLNAATIVLPEGGACLADVLSGRAGEAARTSRISVLGGSGGVGASTLAVVSQRQVRRWARRPSWTSTRWGAGSTFSSERSARPAGAGTSSGRPGDRSVSSQGTYPCRKA